MDLDIPTQRLTSVNFRFYSAEEILALSVKEIYNPQTFDTLMHPTIGGLYDSSLGPTDKDDACRTCGQNFVHCPGHMGHIKLPLPTYNPVYFKTLYQILRGSCFNCHRLTVKPLISHLFTQKFILLDHGLLPFVSELEEYAAHLFEEMGKDVGNEDSITNQITEMVEKRISEAGDQSVTAKNVEAVKAEARQDFLSVNFTLYGRCPHCKQKRASVRHEHQSKIIITGISTPVTPVKKNKWREDKNKRSDDSGNETPTEEDVADEMSEMTEKTDSKSSKAEVSSQRFVTASEAREHMRSIWKTDSQVLKNLYRSLGANKMKHPTDVFFLDVVPVPPCRFRPISVLGDKTFENPQTANLNRLLVDSAVIRQLLQMIDQKTDATEGPQPTAFTETPGQTLVEKLQNAWVRLQTHVNCVVDSELDKISTDKNPGIKQLLEKKEGLFRKHMMGKRVNYAARSVISPDPCISTCEIGIPEVFAKKLTYPQPVTPWNVHELRQAVINGPQVHPGACFVVNEDGSKVLLNMKDKTQREAIAKQLLTPWSGRRAHLECKQVFRHLKNGDVLLLNRQPTLHRPSIQAHKARVLKGEKTLRLHYSNCKAYNADFDGDEMNAHFPQNELARSEAYTIASTDYQYLVPKDGTPLAGLIQDHMVSGVSLSIRGRFFNRQDYCQLVYTALVDKNGPVKLLPPAMIKPCRLWSGKQVLSTIFLNVIPEGKQPLNLIGKSKIPEKSWISGSSNTRNVDLLEMGESYVVIRGGELLCGVLDKGHYGNTPYGLVHCCYELYGGAVAGRILTCLGRLFMNFLQQLRSFTLGVEDILVTHKADKKRYGAIMESTHCGPMAAAEALGLPESVDDHDMIKALKDAHFSKDDRRLRELDLSMKGKTDAIQNEIVGACMPKGLEKLFPHNNLQLMVQSGAKGSSVNCMQISALLGQIELEGRRPPLMLSGKTLPSFMPYDTSPRAGGFVSGRFLTGIRPQEYFFHCMAGREGLIDTAVKTSRSGYLQRCLIKHLEGVMVNYDLTVRDSDGSIVQFYYGEDGMDIQKVGFLTPKQFPFLLENRTVLQNSQYSEATELYDKKVNKWSKKIHKWKKHRNKINNQHRSTGFLNFCKKESGNLSDDAEKITKNGHTDAALKICELWQELDVKMKKRLGKHCGPCPDPVMALYTPFQHKGVFPEKFIDNIQCFYDTEISQSKKTTDISKDDFFRLMFNKELRSLAQPGEAVGLLCAQSIGEPSTQMTLNTFHFAGRGEMNVTLGIPRLREILMVASVNIKTPSMDIPVINTPEARAKAKELQVKLNKVILSEVLQEVNICEYLSISSKTQRMRVFKIKFQFLPKKCYKGRLYVTPKKVLNFMERVYFKSLVHVIRKKISELQKARLVSSGTVRQVATETQKDSQSDDMPPEQEKEELSDEEENDGNAATVKERQKMEEEMEYEEEEIVDNADSNEGNEDDVDMEEDEEEESLKQSNDKLLKEDLDSEQTELNPKQTQSNRINMVLRSHSNISNYRYDVKNEHWCEITLEFSILDSKIDLPSLIDNHVRNTVVYEVPGISRCLLSEEKNGNIMEMHLKTEGINILEMYSYCDILDISRLYSNDIHAIASQYGIEAANKVIIKEIQNVFAAYGIEVDYRHLSLLGDYMTFEGEYKPFNRIAIETCPSPLQKMSFETTMHFLTNASIQGSVDKLKSPSSQIVAGRVVSCGSGTFEVLQPLC